MAFSPDGNKGLLIGADVTLTSANPIWTIINAPGGAIEASNASMKVSSGFSGRMYTFGGYYINNT